MTTTTTELRPSAPLMADQCMAIGPEGDACHKSEFHDGLHDWPTGQTQNGVAIVTTPLQRIRTKLRPPTEEEFAGADFLASSAMERLAGELIAGCGELRHLEDATIIYLWAIKGGKSKGKPTLGKCEKPAGKLRHFSRADFIITLAADHAIDLGLSAQQLEACLYHELRHAGIDEDDESGERKWTLEPHDVETFASEIKRYGLWDASLLNVGAAVRQLKLDEAIS